MSLGRCRFDRTNSASPGGPVQRVSSDLIVCAELHSLTLCLCIPCKHTLNTYAYALHIMHRTPALIIQQIQTYDAIAVDVRMQRDLPLRSRGSCEHYFWRFDGVGGGEGEA